MKESIRSLEAAIATARLDLQSLEDKITDAKANLIQYEAELAKTKFLIEEHGKAIAALSEVVA